MVKFDIIKEIGGWKTVTLTEDIEFSLQRIIKGKKLRMGNRCNSL